MEYFYAALALGFLGSFHCIGMCGPITLALPLSSNSWIQKIIGAFIYNFGRVLTYSLLGAFFGLVGKSFVIAGYQQILSLTLGIAILIMVLLPNQVASKFKITSFIFSYIGKLKQKLGLLFQKKSMKSLFFIGTLNGLLPCGLVYLGVAGAIATGDINKGALFMATFGLGTIPAMFLVSLAGNFIGLNIRNKIQKAVPIFVSAMALLLILRGMNLGIPYLSPQFSDKDATKHSCCHKPK